MKHSRGPIGLKYQQYPSQQSPSYAPAYRRSRWWSPHWASSRSRSAWSTRSCLRPALPGPQSPRWQGESPGKREKNWEAHQHEMVILSMLEWWNYGTYKRSQGSLRHIGPYHFSWITLSLLLVGILQTKTCQTIPILIIIFSINTATKMGHSPIFRYQTHPILVTNFKYASKKKSPCKWSCLQ